MKDLKTSLFWIVLVASKSMTGVLIRGSESTDRGEKLEAEAGGRRPQPGPPEAERSRKDPPQSLRRGCNLATP